jgi:hypothetical protein
MPVSLAVRERCRTFLKPGEQIRYLFPAMVYASAPLIIVVTDSSVTVLSCSWFDRDKPKSIWGRYPRNIRLGPVDISSTPTFEIGTLVLEIDEEYVSVINTADAEIAEADFLPPDPLPDL